MRPLSSLVVTARGRQGPYMVVRIPGHPFAMRRGWVYEHRWVKEQSLGRYLKPGELVHHEDEKKSSNHDSNLTLMSRASHAAHHRRVGWVSLECATCKKKFARTPSQSPQKRGTRRSFCSSKCRITYRASQPHGTARRYQGGCRCSQCKIANSAAVARWRASRAQG